jgi:hypothetical protein
MSLGAKPAFFGPVITSALETSQVFGIGNVVTLIRSVTVLHQTTNALWWALLAIFAVLWGGTTGHEEANPRGGSRRLQTDSSLLASGGV